MDPILSFMVCGAQKAGTSALDKYLRQHPDLFLPKCKELHFFDNEGEDWKNPNFDQLHKYFEGANKSQKCGEATPITMYWEQAPERIWKYNPDMKMIVLLRDPVARAYSHWAMEYNRNAEKLCFQDAVDLEDQRAKRCLPEQDRVHSYIDRGFYCGQIRRLWRFFGKKNVLILQQQWLIDDLCKCLNRIYEHIGVNKMDTPMSLRERIGTYPCQMDIKTRSKLQQIYIHEIKQLEKMLEWDCSQWIEGWI